MSSLALGDCLFSAFRPYNATGTVLPPTTAYNFLPTIAAFTEAMNNAALSQSSVIPIDILAATSSPSSSLLPVVSVANIASSAITKSPPINHSAHANNKHSPPLHQQPQMSKKRQRTTFTPQQASTLEREYLNDQYMPRQRRQLIAESLNLNESQVKTWFQNRRAKEKRTDKAQQAHRSSTSPQTESLAPTTLDNPQHPDACTTPVPAPNYAMILQTMQLNQKLQAVSNPVVLPPF
uniref:Homeobox domain-containing protein n=1 Tax=Steinernema glaseri TaxID=37863 RepID=A0A1I7YLH8_9BILA